MTTSIKEMFLNHVQEYFHNIKQPLQRVKKHVSMAQNWFTESSRYNLFDLLN